MRHTWRTRWSGLLAALVLTGSGPWAWAQKLPPAPVYPSMKVRELPDVLRSQWNQTKPEMNSNSRCAAAFDSHADTDRMTLKCSIYIKLGAVGERRAMGYCEEEREKRHIHAPCKLVREE
jgi:hypothetical protein